MAERSEVVRGRARPPLATGLRRVRLVNQFTGSGAPRLSLVVAPAGCGKTTLLGHVAEAAGPRLAWLTLDRDLGSVPALLAHLQHALGPLLPIGGAPWSTVGEALNSMDAGASGSVLILDELQTLAGTPALEVIRLLLVHQPSRLTLVFGGRSLPDLGLSRYRLTSSVMDIGPDELRFRTWEVEELFRTCHHVRLGSDEIGRLAQRTAGWAAGLQLFHLATAGRPPSARTALLAGVGGGRLTSQYLAEQVLAQLPTGLLDFVLRSSVLDSLSSIRCNELLEINDSAASLDALDRAGLLNSHADLAPKVPEYRYHEVLQTHLLDQLETRLGTATARDLHRRAAELWRRQSAHAAAVRSYSRAQDWEGVRAVIDIGGHDLADHHGAWLDLLPEAMQQSDPWVTLAMARRLLVDGSLIHAVDAYARAVTNFGGLSGSDTATRELRALRSWVEPPLGTVDNAFHQIRLAMSDPRQVTIPNDRSPVRWCAHALALVVAGRLDESAVAWETAVQQPGASPAVEALCALGQAVVLTLTARPDAPTGRLRAAGASAAAEVPLLERLADGLVRLLGVSRASGDSAVVDDLLAACQAADDRWGEALLLLFSTIRGLATGSTGTAQARRAAELMTDLAAPALSTWASAAEAVASAQQGQPWDRTALGRLERRAAAIGPLPHALTLIAAANSAADPVAATRAREAAMSLIEQSPARSWLDRLLPAQHDVTEPRPPLVLEQPSRRLRVDVLGGFAISLDGRPLELAGLRPLHRELLTVFGVFADKVVRRDQLVEWFWPGSDPGRAQHSLQVAVSELRRLLEPGTDRHSGVRLRRDGAGYRLALDDVGDSDVRRLEYCIQLAVRTDSRTGTGPAIELLEAAVVIYRGDLVPEIGYPEWILAERDHVRQVMATTYEQLVGLLVGAGRHRSAVAAARAGLTHDRHRDGLWRQLVTSLMELDEPVAAAAAKRSYEELLVELGASGTHAVELPEAGHSMANRPGW